jgi:hypothetical protein
MNSTNSVNATASPIVPPRLAVPPPGLALDLIDTDRRVGWVSGDVIGFRGFGSHVEAVHAAWAAHRALARRLDRPTAGARPILIDPEPLALARQGDRELILADGRPIATLLRPRPASPGGSDSFGFEMKLQAPADELTMRVAAHLVYRTLRRSGLGWAMWSRDARRGSPPPAEQVPQREPGAAIAEATMIRRRGMSVGAMLVRMTTIALILVLIALAVRPFAVTQPITIPLAVVAVAGLGAAAVGDANRRWRSRRMQPSDRAHVAPGPEHGNIPSRRAD